MSETASIKISPQRSGIETAATLFSSHRFQLMTLIAYAFFLNREGVHVPSGNELVYLLYVYRAWHPHFMAGDWTFLEPTAGHGFFNLATGWLTLLMPLQWAAWVGRFACWTLCFAGLLRLGQHFKLPSWGVWLGILLWMVERQALPTTPWTEWIVGSFEAKCPAYICLIFALDAALRDKPIFAGLLAGLAFSFHSAVGMWGGAAIGWAIVVNLPIRRSLTFCGCTIAAALPGLLSSLPLITGPHAITADEAKFLVVRALPLCLDPFALARPYVALIVIMFGFAVLYCRLSRGRTASMLLQFHLALVVFFGFAFIARGAGRFDLVKLYPARVLAVLAMLFFIWQLMWVLTRVLQNPRRNEPALLATAGFGVLLFLAMPSPVACLAATVASHLRWARGSANGSAVAADADLECTSDFRNAASWISANTPADAVVIAPPWRADAFYFLRRPLIANWHAYRYDAMSDWRKRIELLSGDLSNLESGDADVGDMDLAARSHYRNLTAAQIASLQRDFHATWLITTSDYAFQRVFTAGAYKVYQLR